MATGREEQTGPGRSTEVSTSSSIRACHFPQPRQAVGCHLSEGRAKMPRAFQEPRGLVLAARPRAGQWMPALDAHSGVCGPPYEALWHAPRSQVAGNQGWEGTLRDCSPSRSARHGAAVGRAGVGSLRPGPGEAWCPHPLTRALLRLAPSRRALGRKQGLSDGTGQSDLSLWPLQSWLPACRPDFSPCPPPVPAATACQSASLLMPQCPAQRLLDK